VCWAHRHVFASTAAFIDAEASRQQERVMVETGFAGTDDVAAMVQTARTEDV